MMFNKKIEATQFGLQSKLWTLGFEPSYQAAIPVPKIDPDHIFDALFFEQLRMWWEGEDTRTPLYISGPTGCGKTSTITQFLARVGAPVVSHTCRRRMDKQDLIGRFGVEPSGQFCWFDGPAALAYRHGAVLLINEFSTAPAETWVSCNDLLEGADLRIDATGEVIARHPNTRVIITDNCACAAAGEDDAYLGREAQDASVADRFWHLRMNFIPRETEGEVLYAKTRAAAAGLPEEKVVSVIAQVLDFVAFTRTLGNNGNVFAASVPAVSSRVSVRFLNILFGLIKARDSMKKKDADTLLPNIVQKALDMAYTNALAQEARDTLQQAAAFTLTDI